MLTMEQAYRIKNLKKSEGKSLRKIAEITGHDVATVKSVLTKKTLTLKSAQSSRKGASFHRTGI